MISRIPRLAIESDSAPGTSETNLRLCRERLPRGSQVVDLGAGKGNVARSLRDAGYKVTAMDLRPLPEEGFDGIERVQTNLEKGIPLASESVDGGICQEVAHQLENPWALFREVARILRPGGYFILSTPNMYHLAVRVHELLTNRTPHFHDVPYEEAHHVTPLPLWTLERMGDEAGFSLERTTYNMNYVPVLRLKLPFKTRALGHTLIAVFRKSRAAGAAVKDELQDQMQVSS